MDKIDALDDLLPGFQKFLDDLCQIKLTSDLEEKAQSYKQRITDYIQQFSSQPSDVPPPLPDPTTNTLPRDADSLALEEKLREERERSRLQFAGTSNTLPTLNGHSHLDDKPFPDELKRMSAQQEQPEEDLYYEAPMEKGPPPVPDSDRPFRQIDDLPTYDDPESPPPVTGLPPSLPRPNSNQGYHVLNPEGQDSGGTFSIGTDRSATISDGEIYDDIDQDDDGSFTDYDSDELEVLDPDPGIVLPGMKHKKKSKDKQDDWQNFLNFIESQNNLCDHTGLLSYCDSQATLMKVFRPKVYYCAATNSRLLCYDPKKKYKKPFLDLQLHSGCEISSIGKESKDLFGFQITVKRKTYNFSCATQVDSDKWVETLKVYTNQGLEYDVTGVTDDSIDGSDPTSPPSGMEDPMIGKFETLMKKLWKKKKKHPPQITEEDGCVHGYANILGASFGEPKKDWQKKWIMIKNHQFSCHKKRGDDPEFAFSLRDIELGAPEQKIVKKGREGALKFHKGNETYMYLEALNPLDVGKIMKQALNAMMVSSAASKGSLVKRETTVEKITKFYEALESGVTEQPLYVNTEIGGRDGKSSTPTSPDSVASTPTEQLYENSSSTLTEQVYQNSSVLLTPNPGRKGRKLSNQSNQSADNIYDDNANVVADDEKNIYENTADVVYKNTADVVQKVESQKTKRFSNLKVSDDEEDEMYLEVYGNHGNDQAASSPTTPSPTVTSPSADLLKKATALFNATADTDEMYLTVVEGADSHQEGAVTHPEGTVTQPEGAIAQPGGAVAYQPEFVINQLADKVTTENKSSTLPRLRVNPKRVDLLKRASGLVTSNPFARRKKDEDKKEVEEEADEPDPKKDKKKKDKDKKDKKKKKKTKKDDIEHPDEPPPDPPQVVKQPLTRQLSKDDIIVQRPGDLPTTQPKRATVSRQSSIRSKDDIQRPDEPPPGPPKSAKVQRTPSIKAENKFKDSDKKHLLDADRLQVEKKEVDARKKELSEIKKDIQNKKKLTEDTTEKTNLDLQFKSAQTEWSKCSKRLAEIEEEIEKATKATVPQLKLTPVSEESQLMRNSPASLRRERDGSDSRRSSGSSRGGIDGDRSAALANLTSPERECRTSDMSLQDKIKRFQKD